VPGRQQSRNQGDDKVVQMMRRLKQIGQSPMILLVSLVAVLVFYAMFKETQVAGAVSFLMLTVLLMAATSQVAGRNSIKWMAFLLVAPTFGLGAYHSFFPSRNSEVLTFGMIATFFLWTSWQVLVHVMSRGKVTRDRIVLSVCLYLMLGFSWFSIYRVLETITPGSFEWTAGITTKSVNTGDLIYFSLATLTTVGYGDIVAMRPESRILAVLEAAAGVLYVGVLIARLVSGYQTGEKE
jgi:voltage-gated potassium channel